MRYKLSLDSTINTIFFFGGMWCVFLSGSATLRPHYVILWPVFVILFSVISVRNIINTIRTPRISNQIIFYLIYFICCLISIILSYNKQASLVFTERLLLAFLFALSISHTPKNYKIQQKIVGIFLFFLLTVSYIELFFPSFYQSVFLPLLIGQEKYSLRSGTFGLCIQGFTIGISKNGLWMIIGFALYLSKILTGNKGIKNYGLLLLFFIMVFCTGKRSYSIIAIILMLWGIMLSHVNDKLKKRIIIIPLIIVCLCVGGVLLAKYIPSLNSVVARTLEMTKDGDISDGRFELYDYAIKNLIVNPFGIGVDVTSIHNSYLQLVLELGWLGGCLSILGFVFPIITILPSLKRILSLDSITNIEKEIFLFSVFLNVIVLLSAFVATPFQWLDVIMLLIISQMVMLKTYNQYYAAVTGNNIRTNI